MISTSRHPERSGPHRFPEPSLKRWRPKTLPARRPSSGKLRAELLVTFERWYSRRNGRPKTARPSDDSLKFSKFAGIVQARSDLIARQIRKFSNNDIGGFSIRQVPEHKANRNPCSLQTWFATKDLWIAYDMVFPFNWHKPIVTRSGPKAKPRNRKPMITESPILGNRRRRSGAIPENRQIANDVGARGY